MHLKYKLGFWIFFLSLYSAVSFAANINSLLLFYSEVEEGVEPQNMRYIVNNQFIRIDDGSEAADFILFNVDKKIIYSVNHDDQTILKIKNRPWKTPVFDFNVTVAQALMKKAPPVNNKTVVNYSVKVKDAVCTDVFLIKDTYPDEMKIMYQYQRILSGQQVSTLKNTPLEFQTPCFLVDQVYHEGEYYKLGLPLQITFSRGYAKLLRNYKRADMSDALFALPKGYSEYVGFSE